MPWSRRKSCLPCSKAKLRCNRGRPTCSRCTERNQRCSYGDPRPGPYPNITAASQSPSRPSPSLGKPLHDHIASLHEVRLEAQPTSLNDIGITDCELVPQLNWETSNSWDLDNFSKSLGLSGLSGSSESTIHMPDSTRLDPFPDQRPIFGTDFLDLDSQTIVGTQVTSKATNGSLLRNYNGRALVQRPCTQGKILSSVILGQLMSYPKMMIEGDRLPPFIHPPCYRDGKMALECGEKGSHQCVSNELAVCQSLVRSFYSRTEANADFVWTSIYAEHKRINLEVSFDLYRKRRLISQCHSINSTI